MESKNKNWISSFQKRSLILYIFFFIFKNFKEKKKHDSELDLHVETKVK